MWTMTYLINFPLVILMPLRHFWPWGPALDSIKPQGTLSHLLLCCLMQPHLISVGDADIESGDTESEEAVPCQICPPNCCSYSPHGVSLIPYWSTLLPRKGSASPGVFPESSPAAQSLTWILKASVMNATFMRSTHLLSLQPFAHLH